MIFLLQNDEFEIIFFEFPKKYKSTHYCVFPFSKNSIQPFALTVHVPGIACMMIHSQFNHINHDIYNSLLDYLQRRSVFCNILLFVF